MRSESQLKHVVVKIYGLPLCRLYVRLFGQS